MYDYGDVYDHEDMYHSRDMYDDRGTLLQVGRSEGTAAPLTTAATTCCVIPSPPSASAQLATWPN